MICKTVAKATEVRILHPPQTGRTAPELGHQLRGRCRWSPTRLLTPLALSVRPACPATRSSVGSSRPVRAARSSSQAAADRSPEWRDPHGGSREECEAPGPTATRDEARLGLCVGRVGLSGWAVMWAAAHGGAASPRRSAVIVSRSFTPSRSVRSVVHRREPVAGALIRG